MCKLASINQLNVTMDVIHYDDSDIDDDTGEIGSKIDNFIMARSNLEKTKSRVEESAEQWYKVCFPNVKASLNIAEVCITRTNFLFTAYRATSLTLLE
jgi:hypothetical protein